MMKPTHREAYARASTLTSSALAAQASTGTSLHVRDEFIEQHRLCSKHVSMSAISIHIQHSTTHTPARGKRLRGKGLLRGAKRELWQRHQCCLVSWVA
jgi:hypothetical protein